MNGGLLWHNRRLEWDLNSDEHAAKSMHYIMYAVSSSSSHVREHIHVCICSVGAYMLSQNGKAGESSHVV